MGKKQKRMHNAIYWRKIPTFWTNSGLFFVCVDILKTPFQGSRSHFSRSKLSIVNLKATGVWQ
jgi:hypothetical protein